MINFVGRNNPTQIPEFDELKFILSQESQRLVPAEKLDSNLALIDFEALFELLEFLGITYIPADFTSYDIDLSYFLKFSTDLISEITLNIINQTENNNISIKLKSVLDRIYEYLSQDESQLISISNQKYDFGFVFGSGSNIRVEKAIELYKNHKISKIFISGKAPIYTNSNQVEAEMLSNYAQKSGVKPIDIICENQSLTVQDNVKRSLDLMTRTKLEIKSLIIITSPFAMRRSYINWLKYLPKEMESKIKILRCNSDVSVELNAQNWYKTEKTIRIVLNEYFKIRGEWLVDKMLANSNYLT